jgi:large subunit ribosomal protein L15
MRLDQVKSAPGSRTVRKRIGRGNGSNTGTYSGKGMKGQKARSGAGPRPSFEGGQLPLVKRLPTQRGFTNIFKTYYATVNLDSLSKKLADAKEVDPNFMRRVRLITTTNRPVKILGRGSLERPVTIMANKFSKEARNKIEASGGKAVEI